MTRWTRWHRLGHRFGYRWSVEVFGPRERRLREAAIGDHQCFRFAVRRDPC